MPVCANITSGIPRECRERIGGVRRVLLANYDEVDFSKFKNNLAPPAVFTGELGQVDPVGDAEISMIEMIGASPANCFYEFIPAKWSAVAKENGKAIDGHGGMLYEQTIEMKFPDRGSLVRDQIIKMGKGYFLAIVEDAVGDYFLYGYHDSLVLSEGAGTAGKENTNFNGWTLTLTSTGELAPAYRLANDDTKLGNIQIEIDPFGNFTRDMVAR